LKILVIRFSSIGDIVLTTPVIRSLYNGISGVAIDYVTKASFKSLLQHNPYLRKIHTLEDNLSELIATLKKQDYDYVVDLHRNIRSWRIKSALRSPSVTFDKQNWNKYKMTRFKRNDVHIPHIVKRYGATLSAFNLKLDAGGLDFFLPEGILAKALSLLHQKQIFPDQQEILAVVLGASYFTKRWLTSYFAPLINQYGKPVLLIGGKDTRTEADQILTDLQVPYFDAVGSYDLLTSAALMKLCHAVLTHDTGFMHIAAAFGMPVFSLWGNTVPEFGMTPYKTSYETLEVLGLPCRPCSKLGHDACPKGHFNCMTQLTPDRVLAKLNQPSWRTPHH